MQEHKTAAYIAARLDEWNISYKAGIAKTGIVGIIRGRNPEKNLIALRADMDALPILEEGEKPYRSMVDGIMHACGHDAHMASLLGTAYILQQLRNEFEGSVRLIFQPSEEILPGGAQMMIDQGVLENPRPRCIFGQHVCPQLDTGIVGFRPGPAMASSDEIYIHIFGKGGHGATPHLLIDPILIGAHLVTALQQLVSRNTPPGTPCVLSFGRFVAEGKVNIVPDEAKLEGILRTYDDAWRVKAHKLIRKLSASVCQGMGGDCSVRIEKGYPVLNNEPTLTQRANHAAAEFLGSHKAIEINARMTAEDFSRYSQVVPGCFYRLGIRNKQKGIHSNLHTSTFDVDDEALLTGSSLMAWLVISEFHNSHKL